jgi:putative transcriptional regulator
MMSKKSYKSDILAVVHQTVEGMYDAGVVDKQTMREFDESCLAEIEPITPDQIKAIREQEHVSQSVFARYLNVSKSLVSQWERGEKKPAGPSLKLLSLVQRKGLSALL